MKATSSLLAVFFLLLQGVEASKWNVTYSTSPICGLMGSEVTLSCSYTYPSNTIFEKAYWTTMNHVSLGEPPDLSEESRYRGRVQVDSSRDRCTFILSNVSKTDSQDYYCRVVTSEKGQRWLQTPGVTLSVTDLQIDGPQQVALGQSLNLTCKSSCFVTGLSSYAWMRNGRPLAKEQKNNNQLQVHPVSYEDEGIYTCAVRGHEHLPSPPLRVTVVWEHSHILCLLFGASAACGSVCFICVIYKISHFCRKSKNSIESAEKENEEDYMNVPALRGQDSEQEDEAIYQNA